MALGSNNDEEFDWEAAVAEIDYACNKAVLHATIHDEALPSCSNNVNDNGVQNPTHKILELNKNKLEKKVDKAVRQTTLDKFVEVSEKDSEGHQNHHTDITTNCGNDNVPYSKDASKNSIDPIAAQTWTYPGNVPLREYQFLIVKTALFSNTLVSLPTGLGKTLIAAVVMYNYFRWFPSGKIVFTAPSRPLVLQQIEACHNIVGIPQEWTIDMTGQMSPAQRLGFWHSKRLFFVTPQVLEKDIQSGSCPVNELVCLVVDEAHRAMGNYAYCVVVREIMAVHVQLRILALTATPGSKQATIQMVIDNLQISTLEYRNENDPDVKKYIHNKDVDLITVAMGKESVNVSSLLLEVITPVVQKLCSLGVFYSKDVTKLTPFEFLTAREKFRQSPPAFLAQPQYGEVEAYFGAAITLYHIYKLLFSHGIRPALEMLQQKLQQGSFARFVGRNETVWKVKALMQQSVRHGAPNPKIAKMKEILIDHFHSKDAGNSRVIIFTNFRESVKDIMGSLESVGQTVKAMEFIGQSSGKASKGQSQRVQQHVLQKFRAGGYNTIVATSIGEEGLDIMEVDLVICFDANVSPLRMVQRMGRTGRKRDGRVVILASEGSELQGYLQKQAKGKAIGKHMHNGGITSFNFHSSPRMVPHSYKPEVQFIEMSIEKFVPRLKRVRVDAASVDPEDCALSESETNLLSRYFCSNAQGFWTPSVIAFPHYQLFPSRICNIKHSFRTTELLIDTLQSLKEDKPSLFVPKIFLPNKEVGVSSTVHVQCASDDANQTKFEGERVGGPLYLDTVPEHLHSHPSSPSAFSSNAAADSQGFPQEIDTSSDQFCEVDKSLSKHKSTSTEAPIQRLLEVALPDSDSGVFHEVNASSVNFCQGDDASPIQKFPSSEVKDKQFMSTQNKKLLSNVSSYSTTSLHCLLYKTGFVSVSPNGRVIISSPPILPLLNKPSSFFSFMSRNIPTEASSGQQRSTPMKAGPPEQIEVNKNPSLLIEEIATQKTLQLTTPLNHLAALDSPEKMVSTSDGNLVNMTNYSQQIKDSVWPSCQKKNTSDAGDGEPQTPPCLSKLWRAPEEVVFATPDSCYLKSRYEFKESVLPPGCTINATYQYLSPYLADLAEKGMVPESPILAFAKDGNVATNSSQQAICDSGNENTKSPSLRIVASLSEVPITYVHKKEITDYMGATGSKVCKSPSMTFLHYNGEQLNFQSSEISKSSAMKGQSTPLVNCKSCSHSEEWNLNSADAKSVQKPKKFKRLRKYKEHSEAQISACPSNISPKRNKKLDSDNGVICGNSKRSKDNQHSKISVQYFIDEEAEVSSDQKVSTDEDDNNDCNDEVSESDSFIDDSLEFTAPLPTQVEGGQVDMMAVYRRSLFTQSPAAFHPQAHLCGSQVDSGKELLDHSEMNNAPADTYACSDVVSRENMSPSSLMKDVGIENSCSTLLSFENGADELASDLDTCPKNEEHGSNIARKRKFSLQKVDQTEKVNALDNKASSAVRNLKEDFAVSAKQNTFMGPIVRTFDDDIFEGVDLDALEAEAAEISRSRSNMNASADGSCLRNTDTPDVIPSMKIGSFLNGVTNTEGVWRTLVQVSDKHNCITAEGSKNYAPSTKVLQERTLETENNLDIKFCSPSFDLGI